MYGSYNKDNRMVGCGDIIRESRGTILMWWFCKIYLVVGGFGEFSRIEVFFLFYIISKKQKFTYINKCIEYNNLKCSIFVFFLEYVLLRKICTKTKV
jgi:hypothetical protein